MCVIGISKQRITDPSPSSGIEEVRLKYEDPSNPSSYLFSDPLTLTSGGSTGGGWDGEYAGSITITSVTAPYTLELWVMAADFVGNTAIAKQGDYEFSVACP